MKRKFLNKYLIIVVLSLVLAAGTGGCRKKDAKGPVNERVDKTLEQHEQMQEDIDERAEEQEEALGPTEEIE